MDNDQCIIFDLDSTLIRTFTSDEIKKLQEAQIFDDPKYMDVRSRFYSFDITSIDDRGNIDQERVIGVTRPHLKQFLSYCERRFNKKTFVYTAATRKYGHGIINSIFEQEPLILYSREQCVGNEYKLEKPIEKMIKEVDGLNKYMNMSNAFIIDDRRCSINPNPDNGILIPAYEPEPNYESIRSNDDALLQLIDWFEKDYVKKCKDVRQIYKGDIFAQSGSENYYTRNIEYK